MLALPLQKHLRAWHRRVAIGIIGVAMVLAVGPRLWELHVSAESDATGREPLQPRLRTVSPVPVTITLNEVGLIQPGSRVTIAAPFDGFVKQIRTDIGVHVRADDVLLTLDTGEIDARMREAEAALLKAKAAVDNLEKWNNGPEVSRARRSLASAKAQLANLMRQEKQAKALLDRGIISRNEYDGIVQQISTQDDQVAAAQQDLEATFDRGNTDNRRVAQIELVSAQMHLDEVLAQKAQNVVHAAKPGILMRPPSSSTERNESTQINEGSHVSRGQSVLAVANLDTLVAEMKVDEVDVNQIHLGQDITIESDSFPGETMHGKIISVGGEGERGGNLGGSAHFLVQARFAVEEKRRAAVRIGMSARLTITAYENPSAIVVPEEAVTVSNGEATVQVLDPLTRAARPIAVKTGTVVPSGIEITSGLKSGDQVILPPAQSP